MSKIGYKIRGLETLTFTSADFCTSGVIYLIRANRTTLISNLRCEPFSGFGTHPGYCRTFGYPSILFFEQIRLEIFILWTVILDYTLLKKWCL